MNVAAPTDLTERALWHLELCPELLWADQREQPDWGDAPPGFDDDDGGADEACMDCGQFSWMCECHVGDECGRWRNGRLSSSCSKAGSEECDFECPYRDSL